MARHIIDASDIDLGGLSNNQVLGVRSAEVDLMGLSGASVAAAGILPTGAMVLGVTTRVTVAITGATTFDIGDGTDVDAFGAAIAPDLDTLTDTSNWTIATAPVYPGGTDIVLTANGGNFTAGDVRITVHYFLAIADRTFVPPVFGIAALPRDLTINSITVSPTYWYEGRDASLTEWTARHGLGGTLVAEGSGGGVNITPPTAGTTDRAVDTSTTRRWQGTANLDRGSKDFVLEFVGAFPAEAGYAMACGTRPDQGFVLLKDTGATRFTLWVNGSVLAIINGATGLVAGNYYHVMAFYDASGSCQLYVDGVASGSPAVVSTVGSITDEENFQIGAYGNDTLPWNEEIAFAALWESSGWLDTHLQGVLAAARAAIVGITN